MVYYLAGIAYHPFLFKCYYSIITLFMNVFVKSYWSLMNKGNLNVKC